MSRPNSCGVAADARIATRIISGGSYAQRERRIADAIAAECGNTSSGNTATPAQGQAKLRIAVLLEGLPDGHPLLAPGPALAIARTAPGCLCCTGNLVMRVTLGRLLRPRPDRLYIAVASEEHLESLRALLSAPPWDVMLELNGDIAH